MSARVTSNVLEELAKQAAAAHPHECCGMLLGGAGTSADHVAAITAARKIHAAPATCFEIDPQALVDAHRAERSGGPKLLGYYHSHPTSDAAPSATDAEMASGDGRIWAIIGQSRDITFWRDGETGFTPLSYRVIKA